MGDSFFSPWRSRTSSTLLLAIREQIIMRKSRITVVTIAGSGPLGCPQYFLGNPPLMTSQSMRYHQLQRDRKDTSIQ